MKIDAEKFGDEVKVKAATEKINMTTQPCFLKKNWTSVIER